MKAIKFTIFILILCQFTMGCSDNEEIETVELTTTQMLEGKWKLTLVQNAFGSDDFGEFTLPNYESIIEFKMEDKIIANDPDWGDYTENGELHFIYGNITGYYEASGDWEYWPFSWREFEKTFRANIDPWGFSRNFEILEISEDHLTLHFTFFWTSSKLYYERYND
ncbi:hypothetical protein U0L90_03965 [Flavobacteriaceae sp. LMIT009]